MRGDSSFLSVARSRSVGGSCDVVLAVVDFAVIVLRAELGGLFDQLYVSLCMNANLLLLSPASTRRRLHSHGYLSAHRVHGNVLYEDDDRV